MAAALVALLLGLAGCAGMQPAEGGRSDSVDAATPLLATASELASGQPGDDPLEDATPIKYRGSNKTFNELKVEAPIRYVGEAVTLSFENAPLSEVTHAILSDILGADYLVDGPIPGDVTFRTRTPIERDSLLGVLESLLKANNVFLIRDSDKRFIVSSSTSAATLTPRLISDQDKAAGFSTMVIPLQYISAGGMAEILAPLAEEAAFTRVDNTRNLLMLSGTQAQLSAWLAIVKTFDVDMLEGMSVGLFPLQNSGVEELVAALNQLLTEASTDDGEGGVNRYCARYALCAFKQCAGDNA